MLREKPSMARAIIITYWKPIIKLTLVALIDVS